MKLNIFLSGFLLVGVGVLSFFAVHVLADISDIQYPVSQLGNCNNETECRNYCDKPENTTACLSFAEQNNLMPKEEIEMAKKFSAAGNKGPGGCTGKDSCEVYCNDISHIDACVSFAEKNDLMHPDELREAKKVRDAIHRGIKPPACSSKKSCDNYCEDSNHMEECFTFASEAGLMDDKEKGEAQKMLQAIKRGVKPPPCHGKQACEDYCHQPDNMEVCMNFAIEAGFMDGQERDDAQKMLSAVKKGVKPPNCRGKEECDSYCQSDEHFEECTNFAEAAGFMGSKDAEMARKTRGKGPGECKGKEECESFCNNPANQDVCFKFAEDNGMIPKEELEKMREGMNRMREQGQERMPSSDNGLRRPLNVPEGIKSAEDCAKYDGDWTGDHCDFGIKECIRQGGSWDNQNCNFPEGSKEQRPMDSPSESQNREFLQPNSDQNQFPSQREPREGEDRPLFEGQMPSGEQRPREFQRPPQEFNQSGMPVQPMDGQNFHPQPGFEGQPSPDGGRIQPSEPMPQIQQQPQEQMTPQPSLESAPQSLLNNSYFGAVYRFLLGN